MEVSTGWQVNEEKTLTITFESVLPIDRTLLFASKENKINDRNINL